MLNSKKTSAKKVVLGEINVFVTGTALLETMNAVHSCGDGCRLEIYEELDYRQGHFQRLNIVCNLCDLNIYLEDDPHKPPKNLTSREHVKDNNRFAFAADVIGIDQAQLKLFCSVLDIPGPPDSYDYVHQKKIEATLNEQMQKKLEENREHSQTIHPVGEGGNHVIAVKTDGTYEKRGDRTRGYTSNVGIILLCDANTDRFLDFVVLNKFCHRCVQQKKNIA